MAKTSTTPDVGPARNEVLRCRAGHDFARKVVRGKKPVWCPEHRPVVAVATPKARREACTTIVDGETVEAPKLVTGPVERSDLTPILVSANINPELKRKLRYIEAELDTPREVGDINLLLKTRKELIREANRRVGTPVTEEAAA
jgi:hypothetical protein